MANLKITEYTVLTTPHDSDVLPIVDLTDTTMDATGTTKKITKANLVQGTLENVITDVGATSSELNLLQGLSAEAVELNVLDGITASTDELNILTGVTATSSELNVLHGVTASTLEINVLDAMTSTTAELNILTGVTVTASEINSISSGWIAPSETWGFVSADGNTGIFNVNADVTTKLSVGMKVKYTQSATVKYGVITAIGTFSGGYTPVTIWGGTDYTLTNTTISSPHFSRERVPFGFPMSPTKWDVIVTDSSDRSQSTPSAGTWYNLGSISITLPIGLFDTSYKVRVYSTVSAGTPLMSTTLSNANNTEWDANLTCAIGNPGSVYNAETTLSCLPVTITNVSKTTYYLNTKTEVANTNIIYNFGSRTKTIIRGRFLLL